ncbi:hypothetical protein D3OALGA1CA_301 [Olavius algarvensis associated proteobacterium Delta 3]|nr:hypothetical protein D3OALGA1CA_301 [Olavius algarvensis associated proteobacterium Delta 3]
MALMGIFADQILKARLSLDCSGTFETVSEFALGYPVKRIDRDNGRITLNIAYRKRWLFYKEVHLCIIAEDGSSSCIRVFGMIGVSPLHLLRLSGVSVYRISRYRFRKELSGFLEPYIILDDGGVEVVRVETDVDGILR